MVSVYSVFSAIVFFNLALVAVYVLMRRTRFVINYTAASLSLLTMLAILRLFVPADLTSAFVIKSTRIIPAIQRFALTELPGSRITVAALLALIWGLGVLVCLGYDLNLMIAARKAEKAFVLVRDERVERMAADLGIKCRIKVSPSIREPYSAGVIKPTIYLPYWDLNEQELRTVLSHERQHLRSREKKKKLVFLLLEALFWWNPISHIFRRELDQLLEIQCDARMTSGKSERERLQYAETLLSVMKRVSEGRKSCLCSCAITNSAEKMKQRFHIILETGNPRVKAGKSVLYIALVLVFVSSFFVIAQPYYEPPMSDMEGVYAINKNNSYILKDGNEYILYYDEEMIDILTEYEVMSSYMYSALPIVEKENLNIGD